MKRKVLCIALALLMCMMVTLPTFADGEADTPPERAEITAVFGLKHISGSTYRMWAILKNPNTANIQATLALYDVSYNYITSVSTTSSSITISLNKYVTLSSGTYHIRITYKVNDSSIYAFERTYSI
jgi:hypothetical protein